MATKQKNYVESIPEDCIQIESYNGKEYANLFYSPSTKKFYQAPEMKFRELNEGTRGYVRPMTKEGFTTQLSSTIIEKHFRDKMSNSK